jgi:hypothetical protein
MVANREPRSIKSALHVVVSQQPPALGIGSHVNEQVGRERLSRGNGYSLQTAWRFCLDDGDRSRAPRPVGHFVGPALDFNGMKLPPSQVLSTDGHAYGRHGGVPFRK